MRPYIIEFLHSLVFGADHSNILEDFLYTSFRSQQYIAMTRANAIIDLTISRPLRWLAGNSYKLDKWSPLSMGRALDMVEKVFKDAALDGSVLLNPTLDIFKEIADEQPLFAAYRKFMYEEEHVYSPDGEEKHLIYHLVRQELLNPQDTSNQATRAKTIECAQHTRMHAYMHAPICTPSRGLLPRGPPTGWARMAVAPHPSLSPHLL